MLLNTLLAIAAMLGMILGVVGVVALVIWISAKYLNF